MPYLYSPRDNYCLFWSPKCACTLARRIFVYAHWEEFSESDKLLLSTNGWHAANETSLSVTAPPNACQSIVAVVRNPFLRAVSSYAFAIVGAKDFIGKENSRLALISQFICNLTEEFFRKCMLEQRKDDEICNDISFKSYLETILFCQKSNLCKLDFHHTPQTDTWADCPTTCNIAYIRVETFDVDAEKNWLPLLSRRRRKRAECLLKEHSLLEEDKYNIAFKCAIGDNNSMSVQNKTVYLSDYTSIKDNISLISHFIWRERGGIPPALEFYASDDCKCRNLVRQCFARDFEIFHYDTNVIANTGTMQEETAQPQFYGLEWLFV